MQQKGITFPAFLFLKCFVNIFSTWKMWNKPQESLPQAEEFQVVPERWWDGPTGWSSTDWGLFLNGCEMDQWTGVFYWMVLGRTNGTRVSTGWSPTDWDLFLSGPLVSPSHSQNLFLRDGGMDQQVGVQQIMFRSWVLVWWANGTRTVPDWWWDGLTSQGLLLRDGGVEQQVGVQQIGVCFLVLVNWPMDRGLFLSVGERTNGQRSVPECWWDGSMDQGLNGLESNRLGSILECWWTEWTEVCPWVEVGWTDESGAALERWWDGSTGLSPTGLFLSVGGLDLWTGVPQWVGVQHIHVHSWLVVGWTNELGSVPELSLDRQTDWSLFLKVDGSIVPSLDIWSGCLMDASPLTWLVWQHLEVLQKDLEHLTEEREERASFLDLREETERIQYKSSCSNKNKVFSWMWHRCLPGLKVIN